MAVAAPQGRAKRPAALEGGGGGFLAADRRRRRPRHGSDARAAALSPAAERKLIRVAISGDPEARGELIEVMRPLIASVARRYSGSSSIEHGELMQEGVVGLLRALERFDTEQGTPFWAYASWWVRQAMQQVVAELTHPVVLSDRAARHLARVKKTQREHQQSHGVEASMDDLSAATDLSKEQIGYLIAAERSPRRVEEPSDQDHGNRWIFGEQLVDPRAEDEYDRIPERIRSDELRRLLAELERRELLVVRGRYGIGTRQHTLGELGEKLGISAERVRQIEHAALEKMRAAVAAG